MGLTLRQAAEQCGASRSTIHRALKSGKMSGLRAEDGAWDIDPAELARVFPWDVSGTAKGDEEGQSRDRVGEQEAVLTVKVEMLERQLERERETVDDLRRRLDRAEERVLALTAPLPSAAGGEPVGAARERPQTGLWGRLKAALKGN